MRPQIAPIPDVVVNEGESATLTCTASGVPTPDVEWIKEGEEYNHQKVWYLLKSILTRHAMRV